jgi:hypothetical protein
VARFPLGRLLATPGALAVLEASGVSPFALLSRHAAGDWGDLDLHDRVANQLALRDGSRILSAYDLPGSTSLSTLTGGLIRSRQSGWRAIC